MTDSENAPDILPGLSASATRIDTKKLEGVPWDHSGEHPGSPLFWRIISRALNIAWTYIFRNIEADPHPEVEGGVVSTSTHINGLVDPLALIATQERRIITIGRHDLMTMPVIGWITRRMGSQPVIRKAELSRGVGDADFAKMINQRSMLTMSHCVASGHAAIVMPEGKSHQDSRLHALRTGPLRFTLNAACIAHQKGLPAPVIQPVGLHFRCHHWFRTDVYVEFTNPIRIPLLPDEDHRKRLINGEWVEPPAEVVIPLRDRLYNELSILTPDAPDWETYRAWHLLGHLRANTSGTPLRTLKEEVLAARAVRERLRQSVGDSELVVDAREAAEILHSNELDARILDQSGRIKAKPRWMAGVFGVLVMLLTSPITLPSTGLQALVTWYAGDRTDEGLDARTTHHMLGAGLSPLIFWPVFCLATILLFEGVTPMFPVYFAISMVVIHISNLVFLRGYDMWTDFATTSRSAKLASSDQGRRVEELVQSINPGLGALK